MQFPRWWQAATWTSCFSVTTFAKSAFLASGSLRTHIQATLAPPLCPFFLTVFLFPSVPFPFLKSTSLSSPLSVPSCFYPLHLRERTLSHNSITPLSLWDLHLLASSEWQAEERLASHQSDLGPVLSGDLQGERGLNLISCNAWKCNCPNILTFIFLPPREVPLGTGSSGRFLHSGVHMGESPVYGLFYRQRTTDWFLGLITPVGSGRVLPPSLPLSESAQVSVWIDMAISLSLFQSFLSFLPLPLPLSSHLHSEHLYPEKFLFVSKFCDWYLCVVVLSVQVLLQVSTVIVGTVAHLSLGIQT